MPAGNSRVCALRRISDAQGDHARNPPGRAFS
jgi:hypothetical protein